MVHCKTPRTAAETSTISFELNPPTWFTQTHALHSPFKSLVNWDLVDILLNICLLATLVVAKSPEAALLLPSGRFSQSRPNQERRLVLFHWKGFGFGTTHSALDFLRRQNFKSAREKSIHNSAILKRDCTAFNTLTALQFISTHSPLTRAS